MLTGPFVLVHLHVSGPQKDWWNEKGMRLKRGKKGPYE